MVRMRVYGGGAKEEEERDDGVTSMTSRRGEREFGGEWEKRIMGKWGVVNRVG